MINYKVGDIVVSNLPYHRYDNYAIVLRLTAFNRVYLRWIVGGWGHEGFAYTATHFDKFYVSNRILELM